MSYLSQYEAVNIQTLPCAAVSQQMGWVKPKDTYFFLVGTQLIVPGRTQTVDLAALSPQDWHADMVALHSGTEGNAQIAAGFHAAGTLQGWLGAVAHIAPYPKVKLGFYGSLAPPVLEILQAPNFGMDWSGVTSQGKTTVLRCSASNWGCPDDRLVATALFTWDATRVWIERAAALLTSLPLILDDTKRAKYPSMVSQTIYDLTSGRERGRGSLDGMRHSGAWKTVGLFSGEQPVTSFVEGDGGTRTRILSLRGLPFGPASEDTARAVRELTLGVSQHYGHAGPLFVQYLVDHQDQWGAWREKYRAAVRHFSEKADADPIADRLAAYCGTLSMTVWLAHRALDLPWPDDDPIGKLWADLVDHAHEAHIGERALSKVYSWSSRHTDDFHEQRTGSLDAAEKQPSQGWAGVWPQDNRYLAFYPDKIEALLTDWGFRPVEVFEQWKHTGVLQVEQNQRGYQGRFSHRGIKARGIIINAETLQRLLLAEAEGEPDEGV